MSKRLPELDLLRTVAILCMVAYHAAYDLAVFYQWDIPVFEGAWKTFQVFTASLFLLLVGICFAVGEGRPNLWHRQIKRFVTIGAAAFFVSLATYAVDPATFVRFGILHLVAVAALVLPCVRLLKEGSILLGFAILYLGLWTHSTDTLTPTLSLVFGFPPPGFASLDYFPLLPWLGVIFIGHGLGRLAYVRFPAWRKGLPDAAPNAVTWPGRHSLMIYLVHQPVLLALFWILL